MTRVALVVARYGPGITGGAEHFARLVAHRLASDHEVTVLTTCAEDYVTWQDAFPPGESQDGPVRVLRFSVRQPRQLTTFAQAYRPILAGRWTPDDEDRFLQEQGPDCPALVDHLVSHLEAWDAVLAFTLLYLPTVRTLEVAGPRTVLVPTLHDEPSAKLRRQGRALHSAAVVLWNSPEERDLGRSIWGQRTKPEAVCGVGIAAPEQVNVAEVRERFGLERPYLIYAGRIDAEKGCATLLRQLLAWFREDDTMDVVLIGRAWMDIPRRRRIRYLGHVADDDRWPLFAGALATLVPSVQESLSLVALESLAVGTPILARRGSAVVEGHVWRSAAGILYGDYAELVEAIRLLRDRPSLRAALGRNGRRYVSRNFSWERIDGLYEWALSTAAAGASMATGRPSG